MKHKLLLAIIFCFISITILKAQSLKGDPWIFQVYKELYNRQPNAWELNIHNYNNGSWNNYTELKNYVTQYQTAMRGQGLNVRTVNLSNGLVAALFNQNGKAIAIDLITNDGGSIVASGGGNIVASGAGNIVTNSTGNITGLSGAYFGGNRTLQSTGTKVIPVSGNGALIIK